MEVRSIYKYARMSSQKVRQVTRAITGMPVSSAISLPVPVVVPPGMIAAADDYGNLHVTRANK